jgi:hypothetical protein
MRWPKLIDVIPVVDIVGMIVGSEIPVTTMQDHASAAKLTAKLFDSLCHAEAELRQLNYEGR